MTTQVYTQCRSPIRILSMTATPITVQPQFLTVKQTAATLNVHKRTVEREIADGVLESVMIRGRRLVPISVLEDYMAKLLT